MKKHTIAILILGFISMLPLTAISQPAAPVAEWPQREVDRPLILPRGMFEIGGGMSWLDTSDAYNNSGSSSSLGADYTELYYTMGAALGVYDGIELRVYIPYIQRSIDLPGDPAVEGFGDLDAALSIRLFESLVQRPTNVIIGVRGIFPVGESEIGDDDELFLQPPGRGTFAVGPFINIRETYGRYVAMRYYFEWDFYLRGEQRFEGVTAKSDYGDVLKGGIEVIAQLGDYMAIRTNVMYRKWFASELKHDGLLVAEYNGAEQLEVLPALQLNLGKHFDLVVGTSYTPYGKNVIAGWPVWGEFRVRF